jgi:hypothetical protein
MAESPSFYEGTELVGENVFPNSLYNNEDNYRLYIQQVKAQQRYRIENLRDIIESYSEFDGDDDMENFDDLQAYEEECDEHINNIRTVLGSKERRLKDALYNLEQFVGVQASILQSVRNNDEESDEKFDDVKKKIIMVRRQYQLLENQLEQLARYSLRAIDVLQECKTSARTFLANLLLNQSNVNDEARYRSYDDEDDEDDE